MPIGSNYYADGSHNHTLVSIEYHGYLTGCIMIIVNCGFPAIAVQCLSKLSVISGQIFLHGMKASKSIRKIVSFVECFIDNKKIGPLQFLKLPNFFLYLTLW